MQYQFHFGKKFYLDHKTGYWISTTCPKIRAHRWVWENINGKIPKNCHIHHIDENKSNNDISNLKCLYYEDHLSLHVNEESRQRAREWINQIRPLTKKWHRSEEGKKWHSIHASNTFKRKDPIIKNCNFCTKSFEIDSIDKNRGKFCSNVCKSAQRRKLGLDNIEKKCQLCEKIFKSNKYGKRKYCSRSCASKDAKN